MSQDIKNLLLRLTTIQEGDTTPVSVKSGLNAQQRKANQLPALFRPHTIAVLNSPEPPQHPMKGRAVGSLEERMGEIEEDMLGKIRQDLNNYLGKLEDNIKDDGRRSRPISRELQKKQQTDSDLIDKAKTAVDQGRAEESEELAETIALEDGSILTIHGSPATGFGIRRGTKKMPSRFDNIDDARIAVDLFRARRGKQKHDPDYEEER